MANTKVTGDVIANGTISTVHLADNAITAAKLDSTATGIAFADLTVDTDTLYVDAANNRVGIGTTSPAEKLHIVGDGGRLEISSADYDLIKMGAFGDSGADLDNGFLNLLLDGSEKIRLLANGTSYFNGGNVGIGETNPENDNRLHIKYSDANVTPLSSSPLVVERNDVCLIQTLTSNASDAGILFGDGDDNDIGGLFYLHGSDAMTFRTNTSERMRIDSSGNVMMGKNSQSGNAALTVKSMAGGNTGLILIEGDTTNDGHGLYATTDNKFVITRFTNGSYSDNFVIDSSGNVGIGDTSPQGKLEVNNRNTATGAALFIKGGEDDLDPVAGQYTGLAFGYGGGDIYNNASILWEFTNTAANGKLHFAVNPTAGDGTANLSDSKMTILDSGNVGIGTTSPGAKLEVVDSNNYAKMGDLQGDSTMSLRMADNFAFPVEVQAYGSELRFNTATTSGAIPSVKMNVLPSGNVGIGTTLPDTRLHVVGPGGAVNPPNYSVFDVTIENVGQSDLGIIGTTYSGIYFGDAASALEGALVYYHGDNHMSFRTNGNNEKMRITSAGNIQFAQDGYINTNTADASDNLSLQLSGGGAFGDTRGACIALAGNENGNGGLIQLRAGQGQYSEVRTYTSGAERTRVEDNGDFILYGGRLYLNSGTGYNNTGYIYLSNGRTAIESNIVNLTANGDTSLNFKTRSGGATSSAMYIDEFRNVGIGTDAPTRKLDVSGEITHEGLVPKAGAFVDGLVTINKTVSISANTWTSLDISLSNIGGSGTFAVQVYSNAHGSTGGAWYNMYWSGIMSWFHATTNDNDIDEIPLHMAGHARNDNTLELRTKLHTNDGTSYANRCELQIKTANALSSAPISFRFRKLL
jgi:hypothetical protein